MEKVILKDGQVLKAVSINYTPLEPPAFSVHFATLKGNVPCNNNNYLGVWQSDDGIVHDDSELVYSCLLNSDEVSGDFIINNAPLREGRYVLGYSQVGDPKNGSTNLSATCIIPAASGVEFDAVSFGITLSLVAAGNAYMITYRAVSGMDCGANDNWIGVWEASDAAMKMLVKKQTDSDSE
jgi:hypothetical protein